MPTVTLTPSYMHYCVPPVVNMQELQNHPCLTSFKMIHSSVAKSCHSCSLFFYCLALTRRLPSR